MIFVNPPNWHSSSNLYSLFFRLDRSDAFFVDVIHTAGKWVGNDDTMGHVDFFPNLGRAPQPGCEKQESLDLSCSHWMVSSVLQTKVRSHISGTYLLDNTKKILS
jgi:hypothetical protein